eukprot:Rhum_TRINITY_DN18897_c0_g1::Rhum_TRINITY_DN18897_c0_g1_i1::g.168709::m.168709
MYTMHTLRLLLSSARPCLWHKRPYRPSRGPRCAGLLVRGRRSLRLRLLGNGQLLLSSLPLKRLPRQKVVQHIVRHILPRRLVGNHNRGDCLSQNLLDVSSQHDARGVVLTDLLQLLVIVQEERQPLERHIDVGAPALGHVLLQVGTAAAEAVRVDLLLDLLRRVREEDGRGVNRSGHLRVRALKRREERRVDETGLQVLQARRNVARHAEVRVLVDGTGDEARDRTLRVREDVRESTGEGRCRLDRGEAPLADVVRHAEPEAAADLVGGDGLGDAGNGLVHGAVVLEVAEDKGLLRVEAEGNDVLDVLERHVLDLVHGQVLPVELLVVRDLDHQRDIERVLKPLREHEGDQVPHVHRFAARTPAGVQVKHLPVLVVVQDLLQVSVREEDAAPQPRVGLLARQALHAVEKLLVNLLRPELLDQLVVVHALVRVHRPRVDLLAALELRQRRLLGLHGGLQLLDLTLDRVHLVPCRCHCGCGTTYFTNEVQIL